MANASPDLRLSLIKEGAKLRTRRELKEAMDLFDLLTVERSARHTLTQVSAADHSLGLTLNSVQIGETHNRDGSTRFAAYASVSLPSDPMLLVALKSALIAIVDHNIETISAELHDRGFNPDAH